MAMTRMTVDEAVGMVLYRPVANITLKRSFRLDVGQVASNIEEVKCL